MIPKNERDAHVYLALDNCPFCKGSFTEIVGYPDRPMGSVVQQEVECASCGRSWWEVYRLVDIVEEPLYTDRI